ncbi:DoxX family protein [Candidatus Uhrbacteria bacterium]|nr:DoxX family protein [Candidatus Uhrbacteria bacterium]
MTYLFLLGRVLFGGFFIMSGWNHLTKVAMMKGYTASKGVPSPALAVIVTGLMLLLGGLAILFWFYLTLGVWLLVIFLLAAAFTFHDFWKVTDAQQKMTQKMLFMRNIALTGALLILLGLSF